MPSSFYYQDSYSLFMVLDLCDDAELSYNIWKYCGLSQALTVFYLSEIISCLEYMHSKGIFHRDIKPENVLLHSDGHIRLTDFGTAKILETDKKEKTDKTETKENEKETETENEDENKNSKEKVHLLGQHSMYRLNY
eukprot:TRINITY_DN22138_c0_g1_i1.p1 TRINITY_DN22138_c0_g1~~TRINITY_DN22138_c0_g1_i1.p1  ORF type:complete len:137 (-),score=3.16 TRINITY_DN22138_c0_g1_i1:417-827(-)